MARMTTSTNSGLLNTEFFAKRYLEVLRENLVTAAFAVRENVPRSSGKTIQWNRFPNQTAKTTPLSEGNDPPTSTDISETTVTATLQEFGGYFDVAKLFLSTAATGTKAEIVDAAAHEAAITIDTLIFTQALQDTTTTNTAAVTALTADKIRLMVAGLSNNAAKPHPMTPGGTFYPIILGPNELYDMLGEGVAWGSTVTTQAQTAPRWMQINATDRGVRGIVDPFPMVSGPSVYGAIPYVTHNIQVSGTDQLIYVLAKQGFGAISIDGDFMNPRVIITDAESRVDKPLRNAGTIGWWVAFVSELLDSNQVSEQLINV